VTPATANLDTWEYQYVQNIDPKYLATMAWTDPEACGRYPTFQWVYDKYELSKRMGVKAWDLETEEPDYYPCFVKPKYNLWGMGENAFKCSHPDQLPVRKAGFIAQEYLKGGHLSTDFVIFDSEIVDHFSFIGHKDNKGSFNLWESTQRYADEAYFLAEILCHYGIGHAVINVETINGKIIEAHLRPSIQFFDICGRMINQAMLCFFKNKQYIPRAREYEKTYSQVHRLDNDALVAQAYPVLKRPVGVRSVQHCWEAGLPLSAHAQDMVSYRYMCINGNDLKAMDSHALSHIESLQFRFL
jgi:hypothetical protein